MPEDPTTAAVGSRGVALAPLSRARPLLDLVVDATLAVAVVVLVAAGIGAATGHSLLIDRSDSMRPAIAAGDMLVVDRVRPDQVEVGDIVTFSDPDDPGRTLTHRMVERKPQGSRYAFVTRGDANGSGEEWTVASDGTVGVTRAILPRLGYVSAWLGGPWVRFAFITVAGGLLACIALRRIWSA